MSIIYVNNDETNTTDSQDVASGDDGCQSEGHINLLAFWPTILEEINRIKIVDAKNQVLPLARIKKIMKLDEDVKMISAEAPLLFAKAAEIFIYELTMRAWIHTENNKRRTLQRNDIAMAITKYDQFDFLIDIVPREEATKQQQQQHQQQTVQHNKKDVEINKGGGNIGAVIGTTNNEQMEYYLNLAYQNQHVLQQGTSGVGGVTTIQTQTTQAPQAQIQVQTTPQNILVTNQQLQQQQQQQQLTVTAGGTVVNNLQQVVAANQQQHQQPAPQQQQLQLVQQIVTANGEITHIPIPLTQQQLNIISMQMQNGTNQQILIQSPRLQPTQLQQLQQQQQQQQQAQGSILQVTSPQQQSSGTVYITSSPTLATQQQQQQQQHHIHQQNTTDG